MNINTDSINSNQNNIGLTKSENCIKIIYKNDTQEVKIENELYEEVGVASQCKNLIFENNSKNSIETWFAVFLLKLHEELNDDFTIYFEGSDKNVILIKNIIEEFNYDYKRNFSFRTKDQLEDIKRIIKLLEKNESELIQNTIRNYDLTSFSNILENNEVPIVVIATMSAGKSTLLNTFIGQNLMPSKNEACTATICEVKKSEFDIITGEVIDENNEIIQKKGEINSQIISEFNDKGNNRYLKIKIESPIENINVEGMSVVLIDTPGPNNSSNHKHKEITYDLIKNKNKNALILYVLNATSLGIHDDKNLLSEIKNTLENQGKNALDRILFVLNKIDGLDPEKEKIEEVLNNCRKYLESNGIKNAKIFPVSSKFAYLATRDFENLSRSEKSDLRNFREKMLPDPADDYIGCNTIKDAPIPEYIKEKFYNDALKSDKLASFHYSGFSSLKYYLEQHIKYNHKSYLINQLLEILTPLLDHVISINKRELKNSNAEINKQYEELIQFQDFLDKKYDDQKKNLHEEITNLKFNETFFIKLKLQTDKEFDKINMLLKSNQIRKEIFLDLKNQSEDIFTNLKISLETSIKADCEDSINESSKNMNEIIRKTFSKLIQEAPISENNTDNFISEIKLLINQRKYEQQSSVLKGYKDESSIWFRWFGFGTEKKTPIYENVAYINGTKVYNEIFSPLQNEIQNKINEAKLSLRNNVKKIKENGFRTIILIEEKLQEKRNQYGQKLQVKAMSEKKRNEIQQQLFDLELNKKIILNIETNNG
ncbi:dynamin family protein [Flavobacterium sp. 270]|uniref:dynamin family protein n=1 Tax=Flavobacterium sp. 270 TaxID=2512114 RepID=UPI0010653B56|nr:dynamin family protein [Flavobacterium sp. 270]TDW52750.1 dynamin family protein [Flavobacterium sp. 270]